jgi:hypothetical protein
MWGVCMSLHLAVHVFVHDLVTATVGFSCKEFLQKFFSSCEFHEYWHSQTHTFLRGISEVVSVPFLFSDQFE